MNGVIRDDGAEGWEAPVRAGPEALEVDVDGFEGPLDLLLNLARLQKVDLAAISVLALVEQYLDHVERARSLRLELAADYLVMAAWLAYLKSRLLLPQEETEEPSGEELAAALQFRLRRLEAMREASVALVNRPRLGRDVFARGDGEPVDITVTSRIGTNLYDLLTAYARRRQTNAVTSVRIDRRAVWSLEEARAALVRLVGTISDWTPLDAFLAAHALPPQARRGARASTFAASLEMAREGTIELQQGEAFAPLYMRPCREGDA